MESIRHFGFGNYGLNIHYSRLNPPKERDNQAENQEGRDMSVQNRENLRPMSISGENLNIQNRQYEFNNTFNYNYPYMPSGVDFQPQVPNNGNADLSNGNFPNGANGNQPEKPNNVFASMIAKYLVEKQGMSEEEAARAVSGLGVNTVVNDPIEAVKEYFGITDEKEARDLAEEIFGPPPRQEENPPQQNFFMYGIRTRKQ